MVRRILFFLTAVVTSLGGAVSSRLGAAADYTGAAVYARAAERFAALYGGRAGAVVCVYGTDARDAAEAAAFAAEFTDAVFYRVTRATFAAECPARLFPELRSRLRHIGGAGVTFAGGGAEDAERVLTACGAGRDARRESVGDITVLYGRSPLFGGAGRSSAFNIQAAFNPATGRSSDFNIQAAFNPATGRVSAGAPVIMSSY